MTAVDTPEAAPKGARAVASVLGNRTFALYLSGNALSSTGAWFQNLAAALFVYRETHSTVLLGVLSFAQFAWILVLAPWTGAAADRFDRRRVLLTTQLSSAVVAAALAVLAFTGLATVAVVIVASLLLGIGVAFYSPVQQVLVTSLVEPRDIPTAVSLNSMTFNLARAVGPALAAVVVVTLGIPAAFALNAGALATFATILLVLRPRPHKRIMGGRLRESVALVRGEPRLLVLLLVVMAAGFASDPINTLAPAFAHEFGYPDVVGGYLIGVFGAGAMAAVFVIAGRRMTRRRLIGALLLMFGSMTLFCLSPWLLLGLPFLFLLGFGYLSSNATSITRLQLEVPESQRGRIMSLWSIAFLGLRPVASLIDGAIAAVAGVRVAGIVLTLPALAAAGLLAWRERRGVEVPELRA